MKTGGPIVSCLTGQWGMLEQDAGIGNRPNNLYLQVHYTTLFLSLYQPHKVIDIEGTGVYHNKKPE